MESGKARLIFVLLLRCLSTWKQIAGYIRYENNCPEEKRLMSRNPAADPTKLTEYSIIGMPTRPMRFSVNHWHQANVESYRNITAQQKLADRILAEADRVIDETEDNTVKHKLEVDHQLDVKIKDIEFRKEQLEWQKKQLDEEIDCLKVYMMRVEDAQKNLGHKALDICRKCIVLREGRIGIDLCKDEVDTELEHEQMMIQAVQRMLIRIKEQVKEQMRRLRAMVYSLTRDLEDKSNVLSIDRHNLSLNEKSTCLAVYHGTLPLDPATITQEEWAAHTTEAITKADKELASGRPLRAYIDVILKQIIDDLWRQYDLVNSAFYRRIEQTKEQKTKLENHHFETVRLINELTMKITALEKGIAEKEAFMALAHTRLGNRCQRTNAELCRDEAETYLVEEVAQIKEAVTKLQNSLCEAQASLRYLLRTQVQIEEDINIKTNTLKIDEVDCMPLRAGMDYHAY